MSLPDIISMSVRQQRAYTIFLLAVFNHEVDDSPTVRLDRPTSRVQPVPAAVVTAALSADLDVDAGRRGSGRSTASARRSDESASHRDSVRQTTRRAVRRVGVLALRGL